jgi:hypothetical protein
LGTILADTPIGTHLGVFGWLWALVSGRFLLRRGAVFPALADGGLPDMGKNRGEYKARKEPFIDCNLLRIGEFILFDQAG